jgi:hypothetical protein
MDEVIGDFNESYTYGFHPDNIPSNITPDDMIFLKTIYAMGGIAHDNRPEM